MSAIYQLWRFTAFGRYRLDLQNGSDGEGRTSQLASGLNVAGDEGAGACLVWIPYFLVSKRVKRTFVGATDHRVVLGPHGTGSDKAMSIVVGFGAKPGEDGVDAIKH